MRVFLGPVEIAGYYANLTKGLKLIGVECDFITYIPHPFGYGGETKLPQLIKWAVFFYKIRTQNNIPWILKMVCAIAHLMLTRLWAVFAIFRYDVFIFSFGNSLFPDSNLDLFILKALKKTVITNLAHGSEARPPYIDGSMFDPDGKGSPTIAHYCKKAKILKAKITKHQDWATYSIGAPFSTSQFAKRKFINLFSLGLPFTNNGFSITGNGAINNYESPEGEEKFCRILHSPSHPYLKGTHLIQKAIENLKNKGYSIEFVLIKKRPFLEVIQEIKLCDFVVDQVYSDTPMAGFATEAAWFGKPAVVGGYGLDQLKNFIANDMFPPSKVCKPEDIESAIEAMIINHEERRLLGSSAKAFVTEKWSAEEVARRFLRIIKKDIPDQWWIDPSKVVYIAGIGQEMKRTQNLVHSMIHEFGVSSLQLEHHPELQRAFLNFAKEGKELNA